MRGCRGCLCRSCIKTCCDYKDCSGKKRECADYREFRQLNIFGSESNPKYQAAPRKSLKEYGISEERKKELDELMHAGKYASLVRSAAYMANKDIAEYILLSVKENKSYDTLKVKWELKEMERIPYGRSDFYGYRRLFFANFDRELRRRK